jgi:hypothetical protein
MLVVTRHRVDDDARDFLAHARAAIGVLAARPGFVAGRVGRALDDPGWWVITTQWNGVGAYRRALSSYEVKVGAVPLLSTAVNEPSAYEVLVEVAFADPDNAEPGRDWTVGRSDRAADADSVDVGEGSAPYVPTDIED